MQQRQEKKSETLEVRLPHSQKQAFMDVCKSRGETASGVVRGFVSEYIGLAASSKERAPGGLADMPAKLKSHPRKSVGIAAGIGSIALVFGATPSMADDDVFAALDKNNDRVLTIDEMPGGGSRADGETLLAAMDANQDGKISASEFVPKADVISVSNEGETVVDGEPEYTLVGRRTEYDLTNPEQAKVSVIEMKNTYRGQDDVDLATREAEMREKLALSRMGKDAADDLMGDLEPGAYEVIVEEEITDDGQKKVRKRIMKREEER